MSDDDAITLPEGYVYAVLPVPEQHVEAIVELAANLAEEEGSEVSGFMFDALGTRRGGGFGGGPASGNRLLSGTNCTPTGRMEDWGEWQDQGCGDMT